MSGFELAQINIGLFRYPVDAPEMRGFTDNLGRINALAEQQPGFLWRLVGEGDDATDIRAFTQEKHQKTDDRPFGGGPGEEMFKSFLTEAIANKMVKTGGVGIAASVQHEMLKMQGLQ